MPNSAAALEILIVETHPPDARLTAEALGETNGAARLHIVRDGDEAMAFLRHEPPFKDAPSPDVILLGLNLPRENTSEVFEEIRRTALPPPVIILSGVPDERARRYLHAGAADYMVKGDLRQLPRAVRVVVDSRAAVRKLSPRQVEVLRFIAQGVATRDIAQRLGISSKTVEAHRAELMRRLGIRTVAGLVRFALRASLVDLGAD